jgi:hypothetical protein
VVCYFVLVQVQLHGTQGSKRWWHYHLVRLST